MLVRGVDYAPAAEDLPAVTRQMIADVQQLGLTDADSPRVVAAFTTIALHIGKWPTAYMIRENLPPKPQPMLPGPVVDARTPIDPEGRARVLALMRQALGGPRHGRRSIYRPDEGPVEVHKAFLESGKTRAEFERERLALNGWSDADEDEFQAHVKTLGLSHRYGRTP